MLFCSAVELGQIIPIGSPSLNSGHYLPATGVTLQGEDVVTDGEPYIGLAVWSPAQ